MHSDVQMGAFNQPLKISSKTTNHVCISERLMLRVVDSGRLQPLFDSLVVVQVLTLGKLLSLTYVLFFSY